MEDSTQRLWAAFPSVQQVPADQPDQKQEVALPKEEVMQFLQCAHRCCFANARPVDSENKAKDLIGKIEFPLRFATFEEQLVQHIVIKGFFPASIHAEHAVALSKRGEKPIVNEEGVVNVALLTPLELALRYFADCLTDDREPYAFLPYDQVLVLPQYAQQVDAPFIDFVKLGSYAPFPATYTAMWRAVAPETMRNDNELNVQTDGKHDLSSADFVAWFTAMYRRQVSNFTPSRATVAATTELEFLLRQGESTVSFDKFVEACKRFAMRYAHATDVEGYIQSTLEAASKEGAPSFAESTFDALTDKTLLDDPRLIGAPDELDADRCEEAYLKASTENRVMVTGPDGSGKSEFARGLAAKLKAVYVDTFAAAVKAYDDGASALHQQVHHIVETQQHASTELKAALVASVLQDPATIHRGYVIDDVPSCDSADQVNKFLVDSTLTKAPLIPRVLVKVTLDEELAQEATDMLDKSRQDKRQADIHRREEEDAEASRKAEEKAARQERREKRAAKAERKAKIEAGEIQPGPEDVEPEGGEAAPEEEEEEPPELDEEGNPMEPEAVAQRDAKRKADRARRILLEDLEYLLSPEVKENHRVRHSSAPKLVEDLPALAPVVKLITSRRRVVQIGGRASTVAGDVEFVCSLLSLQCSCIPQQPAPSEETPENPDGSAENDLPIADANLRALTENTPYRFSKWRRYCPVTYKEEKVLVEGSMVFGVVYRGRIYNFASKEKMQRFIAQPHPYILHPVTGHSPVLLLKSAVDIFDNKANLAAAPIESTLAHDLGLTLTTLPAFAAQWAAQRNLVKERTTVRTTRADFDAKQKVLRDDRLKKRLEAEAKKKKKDDKKKPAKKKEEEAAPEDAPAEEAPPEVIVETTADRIRKLIAAESQRNERFLPLLVSTLEHLNPQELQVLFEERVLPPTVVVLDYEEPRPEGEEEGEAAEQDDGDAEPAEELDEDGNPKPKPPPKPFDPTDPKQYRRAVAKLIDAYRQSTEASATDPEPPAEGQPPTKPFQAFNIVRVNTYGKTSEALCAELMVIVHPLAEGALPPQDGEDILPDPEIEEGNPDYEGIPNPSLIPIAKAIHQFGKTLKFCPVSLRDDRVFITGDPALWLSFKGKKYMFASPSAMERFRLNPYLYAKDYYQTDVPPRLWVIGAPFCGKKTLAAMIDREQAVPLFSLEPGYLRQVLAAAMSEEGAMVDGLFVPSAKENTFVQRAAKFNGELLAFDEDQAEKALLKERTQQEQTQREEKREAGEEVEDLDETEEEEIQKALEFEPEEAEAKEERETKLFRQMGAALTRVEPFASNGYVLLARPNSEVEATVLLDEGAFPDAVVYIKSSTESFVNRQIDELFAKRSAEQEAKQAQVVEDKRQIQLKQREIELRKWRRRNIGAEDEPAEELPEPPEDVEAVTMDGIRGELEAQFETESGNVAAVVALLPERRVPLVELNGDGGVESLLRCARNSLAPYFTNRRSLLQAPQVVTYDEAMTLLTNGVKMLSCFEYADPVHMAEERAGRSKELKRKPVGRMIDNEPLIPEPEPEAPKPKKMRTVTKVNEEGEEYEVEEEEIEEEAPPEEEPEQEPLEPEPEYSPEELEDMAKEHQAKVNALENKKKLRAAILGHRVYFFSHYNTLARFLESPMAYWDQPAPLPKVPGPVVCVLEDVSKYENKAVAKTRCAAEHLAHSTGAVFVSLPKLLQWGLLHSAKLGSMGAVCVNASIRQSAVSTCLISRLLHARLRCADVRLRGAVLLNLPGDAEQVKSLAEANLLLSRVFQFNGFLKKVADEKTRIARIVQSIDSPPFSTAALRAMVEATNTCVLRQRGLVLRTSLGFPAPVAFTTTTEAMILGSLSPFQTYCPSKWVVHEQLKDIRYEREFCVFYLGHYFCFSSKEAFDEFLLHPDRVSGEATAPSSNGDTPAQKKKVPMALPKVLPTHFSAADATTKHEKSTLELAGCCPVTLYQTRFNTGLKGVAEPVAVLGDKVNCLVEYDKKFYAIANLELVALFLQQPWVFAKFAVLPDPEKLPFDAEALRHTADPELYIRRMIREPLAHAILAACHARPKYPGLSAEESALKFIGLHLKAHNKSSKIPLQQYNANFALFERESTLYKTITTTAPEDPKEKEQFTQNCDCWDQVQDAPDKYQSYIHLRKDHEASI